MAARIFIDGEAGTTGLQIRERLARRGDVELIAIESALRRHEPARRDALNAADLVVLCLPDEAARDACRLIARPAVRVIDASTAHRTAPGWTYGFAEMAAGQAERIAAAPRVANPGCYATGFIALVRPLVEAGLVDPAQPLSANAVSGYSGGGRAMIDAFEGRGPAPVAEAFRLYALGLEHKHVPEMQAHAGLSRPPLFAPAVGRWRQGMLVEVPLHLDALAGAPSLEAIHRALAVAYADAPLVEVAPLAESDRLDPEGLNGTDRMRLYVFGSEGRRQARLVALLDNLGKGAAGAAVQNLELMLGLAGRDASARASAA